MQALVGRRFERLIVIARAPNVVSNGRSKVRWLCRCDCGTEKAVNADGLRAGNTKSCGCLNREKGAAFLRARNTTHGQTRKGGKRTPTYASWRNMRYRCTSPSDPSYARYGGAGVTICERWDSFENFRADMGERPVGMTLDRIDNAKGYEPGNCRWATPTEQQNNRSCNHFVEFDGRRLTITQWAREIGITPQSLHARIQSGWPLAKALSA